MPVTPTDSKSLLQETVWMDKYKYDDAESQYQRRLTESSNKNEQPQQQQSSNKGSGGGKARKHQNSQSETNAQNAPQQQPQPPPPQKAKKQKGKPDKSTKQIQNKDKKSMKPSEEAAAAAGGPSPSDRLQTSDKESSSAGKSSLADEIARARQHIKNSLLSDGGGETKVSDPVSQTIEHLEVENKILHQVIEELRTLYVALEKRVGVLEKGDSQKSEVTKPEVTKPAAAAKEADDDDVDLFGSDEGEDEEKEKLHQERLKAYQEKKSKKPALIAKSNVILDVKPWDDETDMNEMERKVRSVEMDGLKWGASKFVPLAYGIRKLQIGCVVEDEKVSVDLLQETIEGFEDLVQSVDIAAFNKL